MTADNEFFTSEADALEELRGRYLSFFIGDTLYGLELLNVIEIISVQPITQVPGLPDYMKGIINLRGKVVPVIDVRKKFHMEERAYDDKTCIIIAIVREMNVGLIVDSVDEVVAVDSAQSSPPPDLGKTSGDRFLSSIAKVDGRVIMNIDCEKFFSSDIG